MARPLTIRHLGSRGLLIAAALLAAGCSHPAGNRPFAATVSRANGVCLVQVDGQTVTSEQLLAIARREVGQRQRAQLLGAGDVPYRCIGQVIYVLQVAGFSAIDFKADPPSDAP